jgi:hypothetical protein
MSRGECRFASPRFRAFGMEPLRVSTLTGFNRISRGAL